MSTPKGRRSPKRSDVLKTPKNSAIDGEPHVNPNETAGIINQFEVLPEPDREFLSFEIRRTLEKAIRALSNFRLSEKGVTRRAIMQRARLPNPLISHDYGSFSASSELPRS